MHDQILLKKLSEYFIHEEDVPPTQLLYRDGELSLYVGGIDMLPGDKVVRYTRQNSNITIDALNEIPPLVKYSGEEWLELNGFSSTKLIFLFNLQNQLKAANKNSENLDVIINWINLVLSEDVFLPDFKSDWGRPPFAFQDVAREALTTLNSV
jgi:hypothetical protein